MFWVCLNVWWFWSKKSCKFCSRPPFYAPSPLIASWWRSSTDTDSAAKLRALSGALRHETIQPKTQLYGLCGNFDRPPLWPRFTVAVVADRSEPPTNGINRISPIHTGFYSYGSPQTNRLYSTGFWRSAWSVEMFRWKQFRPKLDIYWSCFSWRTTQGQRQGQPFVAYVAA